MIERTDGKKEKRKMRNDDERRNMMIVVCGHRGHVLVGALVIPIEWAWILVLTLVGRFGTLEVISFCCLSYCAALLYA